jgi:LysM repeat protein
MGIKNILIIIAVTFSLVSMKAQEIVNYSGETCYLHIVEKGNTLYGISKQYAVGIPDIFRLNPDTRLGISLGQKVYIPISDINRREAKKSPTLDGSMLIHEVQRAETLYSLSKKYKVDINAIMAANPAITDGSISRGQEVRIPTSQVEAISAVVTRAAQDSLLSHTVLQGETLYGISKLYQVSIDSLKAVNDDLAEGLKTGGTIRIPIYRQGFVPSKPAGVKEIQTEVTPIISRAMREIKVAILLPFTLVGTDTTSVNVSQADIVKMTDIAFEFYRGTKFALEDLKNKGLRARVIVMDVGSAQADVDKAIKALQKEPVDLVIGPLHRGAFKHISNDPRMKGTHFISPVSKVLDVSTVNNSISKVSSSNQVQLKHLVGYLKQSHAPDKCILVKNSNKSAAEDIIQLWSGRDSAGIVIPTVPSLQEIEWGRYFESSLEAALSPSSPNVLIFPTLDRTTVTEFVSKLAVGRFRKYDITLVGLEDWLSFDNLDTELLSSLKLTVSASSYLDHSTQNYKDFMNRYYQSYNTIPGPDGYAFKAYDIAKFYVGGMLDHGPYFLENQSIWKYEGLQIGFEMTPAEGGCFENSYSVIIQNQGQDFKVLEKH